MEVVHTEISHIWPGMRTLQGWKFLDKSYESEIVYTESRIDIYRISISRFDGFRFLRNVSLNYAYFEFRKM
jgi:hypothetical protein